MGGKSNYGTDEDHEMNFPDQIIQTRSQTADRRLSSMENFRVGNTR